MSCELIDRCLTPADHEQIIKDTVPLQATRTNERSTPTPYEHGDVATSTVKTDLQVPRDRVCYLSGLSKLILIDSRPHSPVLFHPRRYLQIFRLPNLASKMQLHVPRLGKKFRNCWTIKSRFGQPVSIVLKVRHQISGPICVTHVLQGFLRSCVKLRKTSLTCGPSTTPRKKQMH